MCQWTIAMLDACKKADQYGFEINLDDDDARVLQEQEVCSTFSAYGYDEDAQEIQNALVIASLRG